MYVRLGYCNSGRFRVVSVHEVSVFGFSMLEVLWVFRRALFPGTLSNVLRHYPHCVRRFNGLPGYRPRLAVV